MLAPSAPTTRLNLASQALRDELQQLTAAQATGTAPLGGLLSALSHYEQAVRAYLPPAELEVGSLTPAQLLAYREADPIYQLGWVRGHKAGVAQGQQATAPVLDLYAQHAALPPPTDPTALMRQVRQFIATLQQRQGAGPTPFTAVRPA